MRRMRLRRSFLSMNLFLLCLALFFCACLPLKVNAAEEEVSKGSEQELELTASLVSLASYSDELSLLARSWLTETGWHFDSHQQLTSAADGRYHLVTKELTDGHKALLLAFPGTENLRDAKVDLRTKAVPFGGTTPKEFSKIAQGDRSAEAYASYPLVHKGFDDYTMTALFQTPVAGNQEGRTMGELLADELRLHPDEILILTGHSLGGAAATLTAARLSDMGVQPEQLRVITFGAPAVGDERFARRYEHKMQLTRVVMDGDPVAAALQSLGTRYVQFGTKERWQQNRSSARFAHEMVVYLDDALRSYLDLKLSGAMAGSAGKLLAGTPKRAAGEIVVAPLQIHMDPLLAEDLSYAQMMLEDSWQGKYSSCRLASATDGKSLTELCQNAQQAGSRYVVQQVMTTQRLRKEEYNFRVILETAVYDTKGNLLAAESKSTTASRMTPLEAVLYLQFLTLQDVDTVFGVQNT